MSSSDPMMWGTPVPPSRRGRAAAPPPMVLPQVGPDGVADGALAWWDHRVPARFSIDAQPQVLAAWSSSVRCPAGRHQWDALVVTEYLAIASTRSLATLLATGCADPDADHRRQGAYGDDEDDRADEWQRFRLRLTCIRCGRIEVFEGLNREATATPRQIDPVPLRAGCMLAQQIASGDRGVLASWIVHDSSSERPVGGITWAATRRGRTYYQGRLDDDTDAVRGDTPLACLRRLARRHAAASEPDLRPVDTGGPANEQHRPDDVRTTSRGEDQ